MAWDNGTTESLLRSENNKVGRIGSQPLMGLIRAARDNQGQADQPAPRTIVLSSPVTDWATTQTLASGPGRLYRVRIDNLTADIVFAIFADSVIAQVIGAVRVGARISSTVATSAEVTFFEDPNVTGERYVTSLLARAFKLDGTGSTAAATGLTLTVLVG